MSKAWLFPLTGSLPMSIKWWGAVPLYPSPCTEAHATMERCRCRSQERPQPRTLWEWANILDSPAHRCQWLPSSAPSPPITRTGFQSYHIRTALSSNCFQWTLTHAPVDWTSKAFQAWRLTKLRPDLAHLRAQGKFLGSPSSTLSDCQVQLSSRNNLKERKKNSSEYDISRKAVPLHFFEAFVVTPKIHLSLHLDFF